MGWNRKSVFLVSLAVVLIAVVSASGFWFYRYLIDLGYEPCVLSAQDALSITLTYSSEFKGKFPVDSEWRILSDDETDMLFEAVKDSKMFDCKNFPYIRTGRDKYGDHLTVLVRKRNDRIEVQIQTPKIQFG